METASCLFGGGDGVGGLLNQVVRLDALGRIKLKRKVECADLVAGNENVETAHLVAQLLVALCLAHLTLERADLALHFAQDVRLSQKVLLRLLDLADRLLAVCLELRDSGGLLEHRAAVLRLG